MNTAITIMTLSLLVGVLLVVTSMFTFILSKHNNEKTSEKEFTKDEAILYVLHFVYLSIYKMYENDDLLDFKSFAKSVESNINILMSDQTIYNECLSRMKEHINEQ